MARLSPDRQGNKNPAAALTGSIANGYAAAASTINTEVACCRRCRDRCHLHSLFLFLAAAYQLGAPLSSGRMNERSLCASQSVARRAPSKNAKKAVKPNRSRLGRADCHLLAAGWSSGDSAAGKR